MNLCEYGCGQIAIHQFKNDKWCCSRNVSSCINIKNKKRESIKASKIQTKKLCDYGCGQKAKYQFKNSKFCCSKYLSQCSNIISKKNISLRKNWDISGHPAMGMLPWNKGRTGVQVAWNKGLTKDNNAIVKRISNKLKGSKLTEKHKLKLSQIKLILYSKKENHPSYKGSYYGNNIAFYDTYASQLTIDENPRRDVSDPNILTVVCAYCNKRFIPKLSNVGERVRSLNGKNYGEQRLYCSENCKQECPIYKQQLYPKDFEPASSREVQPELRQMRFKIDNYTCKKCGKHQSKLDVGLHCHHLEGIRWNPLESADIDKVITLCKNCHKKVHKKKDCGYNDMKC